MGDEDCKVETYSNFLPKLKIFLFSKININFLIFFLIFFCNCVFPQSAAPSSLFFLFFILKIFLFNTKLSSFSFVSIFLVLNNYLALVSPYIAMFIRLWAFLYLTELLYNPQIAEAMQRNNCNSPSKSAFTDKNPVDFSNNGNFARHYAEETKQINNDMLDAAKGFAGGAALKMLTTAGNASKAEVLVTGAIGSVTKGAKDEVKGSLEELMDNTFFSDI